MNGLSARHIVHPALLPGGDSQNLAPIPPIGASADPILKGRGRLARSCVHQTRCSGLLGRWRSGNDPHNSCFKAEGAADGRFATGVRKCTREERLRTPNGLTQSARSCYRAGNASVTRLGSVRIGDVCLAEGSLMRFGHGSCTSGCGLLIGLGLIAQGVIETVSRMYRASRSCLIPS